MYVVLLLLWLPIRQEYPPPCPTPREGWALEVTWEGYPFGDYRWYDTNGLRTDWHIEWSLHRAPPHIKTLRSGKPSISTKDNL